MPYVVAGIVLYLLWRYYAQQEAAQQQPSNGGLPHSQPSGPTNGNGGGPPGPPAPSATGTWVQLTGSPPVVTPGATYRASAPPQGGVVMMMLPGELARRGFTDVHIYPPGTAFPADWPDSGNMLRLEGTLPATAQQGTFDFEGVTAWRWTPAAATGVEAVMGAVQAARQHVGQVMATHPHPTSVGVYAGLVRPPPRR